MPLDAARMPAQVARSRGRFAPKISEDAPPEHDQNTESQYKHRESAEMDHQEDHPVDPDAQTTVNDFLDFTEYLPSDMMRSLTLIGKLDQTYTESSMKINGLTTKWGQLPSLPANERPPPAQLRADISAQLNQALSSRIFAHAEAVRTSENVNRHYNKAKVLLAKLQSMMENYPSDEQQAQSPVASRSPQLSRAKLAGRADGEGGYKVRQKTVPRITVPGEVLAPYDLQYDTVSDGSDVSSEGEEDIPAPALKTPAPPRIKIVTANKPQKSATRPPRPPPEAPSAEAMAAHHAALKKPPPPDAVIGGPDAPWLQLTEYELARLRKRMKKNATWSPSETMVARELRDKGRGPEDYKKAKKLAEDEGRTFDPIVPIPVANAASGVQQLPAGAISLDAVVEDDLPNSNRGMKLNEAKKIKREAMHKLAAEEAEEAAKTTAEVVKLTQRDVFGGASENSKQTVPNIAKPRTNSRANNKRKRGAEDEEDSELAEGDTSRSLIKRTKTETPVPPPQYGSLSQGTVPIPETPASQPLPTPTGRTLRAPLAETPVPLPIPLQSSSNSVAGTVKSPTSSVSSATKQTLASSVPVKPPAAETPVPLPRSDRNKTVTPVVPPVREMPVREATTRQTRGDAMKRQIRGDAAKQTQQQADTPTATQHIQLIAPEPPIRRVSSRVNTPAPEAPSTRHPSSRGKATSQEPQPSVANDRPRRTSTARNTPAPEPHPSRPSSKRSKRPAPGVVSTTSSGGNSAVGKRKAAPKKKARTTMRKEKDQPVEIEMEDVDDEGIPIDPNEPRYCVCNRVSFGTMIQCENADVSIISPSSKSDGDVNFGQSCKQEWFHLECVDLEAIPARTTKWFCPDCRKTLHIGGKGQISARGVRK